MSLFLASSTDAQVYCSSSSNQKTYPNISQKDWEWKQEIKHSKQKASDSLQPTTVAV